MAAPAPVAQARPLPQVQLQAPHLFEVISADIKQLIWQLKYIIAPNNYAQTQAEVNQNVADAVRRLQDIDGVIRVALANINANNNVQINTNANGIHTAVRHANYGNNIVDPNVQQFFNDANTRYTPDGTLANGATNISIDHIDNTQAQGRGTLVTDYTNNENLDLTVAANANRLRNRLENCQYLEILYLTKHDELMKLFAFTLTVFNKYKYAIRILLFVLKNLLDTQQQPPPDDLPPPDECPPCPTIDLPKALIPNIKSLIRDQKKVQEVIAQMQTTLDADQLATPANSQLVENPNMPGNINDQGQPL